MKYLLTILKRYSSLILVFLVGAFMLFYAIDWCLPEFCDVDERSGFVPQVEHILEGKESKLRYNHPAHTESYFVAHTIQILENIGDVTFQKDEILYIARILTATTSIGIGFILYLIIKTFLDKEKAILATLLYVINPQVVQLSKTYRPEIFLTFCLVLSFYFLLRFYKDTDEILFWGAPFFVGLATMSKYPGLIGLVPIGIVVLSKYRSFAKYSELLLNGIVAFIIGVVSGSPAMLLNLDRAKEAVLFENRTSHLGADGLGFADNLLWYLERYSNIWGILLSVLFILTITWIIITILKKKRRHSIPIEVSLSFLVTVTWLIAISTLSLHWVRWFFPTIPFITIILIYGYSLLCNNINSNTIKILFFIILISVPFVRSLQYVAVLGLGDTRIVQEQWIDSIGEDKKIAHESYTGKYPAVSRFHLNAHPLSYYTENEYDYLIVSSYIYERFLNETDTYSNKALFYQNLFDSNRLIKTFIPAQTDISGTLNDYRYLERIFLNKDRFLGLNGPEIRVYEIQLK